MPPELATFLQYLALEKDMSPTLVDSIFLNRTLANIFTPSLASLETLHARPA
jgi:hypothetical protein